jgi:DNA-binding XRE family transcriptional regulator
MNKEEKKIRQRIMVARIKKGYSQDYLGIQLDISQVAYHNIEKGKTKLTIKKLLSISKILGVRPKDFFKKIN